MLHNTAAAAAALGVSQDVVIGLCEAGDLHGQRNRRGYWLVEEDSLTAWRATHPGVAARTQDAAPKKILAPTPTRRPRRCHFCRKPASEWIVRMLPGVGGELKEREVGYCGLC